MEERPDHSSRADRLWRRVRMKKWFSDLTSSTLATIIGIGLTFGIDSCIERQRKDRELRKSMLQAVDNLGERFDDTELWMQKILNQNRVYEIADSIYYATGTLPDSICEEVRYTLPFIKVSAFDHDFEKIFRGSYQLWQLQSANDSLAYYIGQCYDGLNTVETTCQTLTEELLVEIGQINAAKHFHRLSPREWTETLITDPQFQYYMSIRWGKATIASYILQEAKADYEKNVLARSRPLREDSAPEDE